MSNGTAMSSSRTTKNNMLNMTVTSTVMSNVNSTGSAGGAGGATTSCGIPSSKSTASINNNNNNNNNNNSTTGSSANGVYHGREKFDPVLILAQIVLLQACFYTSYLLCLVLFHRATGTSAPLTDQMLDHDRLTLSHFPGWVTCTALLVSACGPTALCFVAVVGRARRALDFAATLLVSHIIATTVHSGFPMRIFWWVINIIAAAGLATVAESLSLRVELREISINRDCCVDNKPSRDRPSSTTLNNNNRVDTLDMNSNSREHDIEAQHLHSQGATSD